LTNNHFGTNLLHMEQNLTDEIIAVLMGEELHMRALAKKLKTNHMTVARKLRELVSKNVLDFREEGKNKVYFLKKTVEAKGYIFRAELYKLNKTLIRYPELRGIINSIQENPKIELAVLFGSYARGITTKNSDIDIFVEAKGRKIKEELELLNSRLSLKIGKYDRTNPVIKEIERDHVIIKGVELFYAKSKFSE
jgi:predicted nucleotidyltransferase